MRNPTTAVLEVLSGAPGGSSGRTVRRVARSAVIIGTLFANAVGGVLTVLLLLTILPVPGNALDDTGFARNAAAIVIFTALSAPAGLIIGNRIAERRTEWLVEEREPTDAERRSVVTFPAIAGAIQAGLWLLAACVFATVNAFHSGRFAIEVGITVAMSGLVTAIIVFLLTLRFTRAITARALAGAEPTTYPAISVTVRAVLTWALGTTVPISGALVLALFTLNTNDVGRAQLARSVIALSALSLGVGLVATIMHARTIAEPLRRLRDALRRVEDGDLDVEVAVNDATEIGFLQSGFNRMAAGLRERERVQDLFERHVGEDVVQLALEGEMTLGGEELEAAVLFVDVIGSTDMAMQRAPGEVVTLLNAFFAVVVEEVLRQNGVVNKFMGDGALCIFGATQELEDPSGAALATARAIQRRLHSEVPALRAGIGVSAGVVVAGNVGAADRFEYTVIGDPVNEASRLTELAKGEPSGICASEMAVHRAGAQERGRWALGEAVELRGRGRPTRVAVPVTAGNTEDDQ